MNTRATAAALAVAAAVMMAAAAGGARGEAVSGDGWDAGSGWVPFWWYRGTSYEGQGPFSASYPAGADPLSLEFGSCAPDDAHCFGRMPAGTPEDGTELLAVDNLGTAYRWTFNSANNVAHRAFGALRDGTQGAVRDGNTWNPTVLNGAATASAQDSFRYTVDGTALAVRLDDDNGYCHTTLDIGGTPEGRGVGELADVTCVHGTVAPTSHPLQTTVLTLYFRAAAPVAAPVVSPAAASTTTARYNAFYAATVPAVTVLQSAGAVSVQWYRNGAPVAGATSLELGEVREAGVYHAVVTDADSGAQASSGAVTVGAAEPLTHEPAPGAGSGAGWIPFWWYHGTSYTGPAASLTAWPAGETAALAYPFAGSCSLDDAYCFGRIPATQREDGTELLAVDAAGTVYRWAFDSGNQVAGRAFDALRDGTVFALIHSGDSWAPEVLSGAVTSATQDSIRYSVDNGITTLRLDDDNGYCHTTLDFGGSVYGIGVNLPDPVCENFNGGASVPNSAETVTLYFRATSPSPPAVTGGADADVVYSEFETVVLALPGAVEADGPVAYQWYRNGVAVAGATGATHTVLHATIDESGAEYHAVVTDVVNGGQATSATLTMVPDFLPECDEATRPAAARLVMERSGVEGANLRLSIEAREPLVSFSVSMADCSAGWVSRETSGCTREYELLTPLAPALAGCGFELDTTSEPGFALYAATLEVTEVVSTGAEVFGVAVQRTDVTAMEVVVRVPTSVQVTSGDVQAFPGFAGLEVDGRTFAVVSTQAYNVDDEEFTLRLITAVAWPYVLELDGAAPFVRKVGTVNDWVLGAATAGGDCDSGAAVDNVCVQQWDLTLDRGATSCETDGEYEVQFDVRCSDAFGNGDGCETHENPTASVTVPLQSDSVCARVVEVATVTPTLVTSTSKGGSQATDFVLQTTLFGRVSVAAEGGVATTGVALTALEIQSGCTSCVGGGDGLREPMSDISPAASSYAWFTTPGVTFADFEFQLNANSVVFDTGAGQASVTLTATVAVTYDEAGDQRTETRRVQVQAAAGRTAAASTTSQVGVRAPDGATGGGSSSSAGSSGAALSGTVAVAAAAALAIVAAAAVAVGVRRRRAAAAAAAAPRKRVAASSSSTSLPPPAAASVPALELANVQQAYDTLDSRV